MSKQYLSLKESAIAQEANIFSGRRKEFEAPALLGRLKSEHHFEGFCLMGLFGKNVPNFSWVSINICKGTKRWLF